MAYNLREGVARYDNVAVALHWLIVVVLIAQFGTGWIFSGMERGDARTAWFEWHRTLGFLVLLLTVVRLGWRLTHPPPPFPPDFPGWQRILSRAVHWLFYALLIALPLAGWVYVSTGSTAAETGMTTLVGGTPWPIIPGLPRSLHRPAAEMHVVLVWIAVALFALHVAAALKQRFVDRSPVANRMPPFRVRVH